MSSSNSPDEEKLFMEREKNSVELFTSLPPDEDSGIVRAGKPDDDRGKPDQEEEEIKEVSEDITGNLVWTKEDEESLNRILVYSTQSLYKIRESDSSQKWPAFLDESFKNTRGRWDPDRWHQNRKRGNSPPPGQDREGKIERSQSSLSVDGKPRNPKDRIKAEQDGGIVLGPRRRSFLTGCQVSANGNSKVGGGTDEIEVGNVKPLRGGNQSNSIISEREEFSLRPEKGGAGATSQRRVGSGRLMNRNLDDDYGGGERRYERYGFNREEQYGDDSRGGGGGNLGRKEQRRVLPEREHRDHRGSAGFYREERENNYNNRDRRMPLNGRGGGIEERGDRRRGGGGGGGGSRYPGNQEPEWMSEEVEQGDMMELRGFNDSPEKEQEEQAHRKNAPETKTKKDGGEVEKKTEKDEQQQQNDKNFNFNDFFQLESIPGLSNLLADEPNEILSATDTNPMQQGRFSKFFQQKQQQQNSQPINPESHGGQNSDPIRRSSIQDEMTGDNSSRSMNLRRINDEPNIRIPSPSENNSNCYFAPISPAAKTTVTPHSQEEELPSLMHLLKMNGGERKEVKAPPHHRMPPALSQLHGKNVKSVGGLGANLRQMAVAAGGGGREDDLQHQHRQLQNEQEKGNQEGELSAFNRFAAMLKMNSPSQNQINSVFSKLSPPVPSNNFPSGILRPNPVPANAQVDPEYRSGYSRPPQHHINPPPQPQQQRQVRYDMQQQLPDILNFIWRAPFNLEVLQRPEAHNLIRALEQGDATHDSLIHQFCSGNLPKLHREIVLNVLKVQQGKGLLPNCRPPHPHPRPHITSNSASSGHSPMMQQDNNLQQMWMQQQHQHHQRLSPGGILQQQGNKMGNNLAVSPTSGHQRVPSPQELVYHTQQIMQNALIRRKLEEQKENFRKKTEPNPMMREANAESDHLRNNCGDDPVPSSFNFTPTVVMKGLAAERRDSDPRPQVPELRVQQMVSGGNYDNSIEGHGGKKTCSSPLSPGHQGSGGNRPSPMMPPVPLPPPNSALLMMQQQEQAAALQQQAQAFQMAALRNRIHQHDQRMILPGMERNPLHPMMSQQETHPIRLGSSGSANGSGGEGALAQFFSPDLLAQAQSGNTPTMPPLPTQKVLTLEELECHAAATH